mmetsp:Transcript_41878/g.125344  ORF Transcript_41878/g.125344 Transcript_41878/m.125344 type:complete len:452 (+) Transcript_41878:3196-4551(+)
MLFCSSQAGLSIFFFSTTLRTCLSLGMLVGGLKKGRSVCIVVTALMKFSTFRTSAAAAWASRSLAFATCEHCVSPTSASAAISSSNATGLACMMHSLAWFMRRSRSSWRPYTPLKGSESTECGGVPLQKKPRGSERLAGRVGNAGRPGAAAPSGESVPPTALSKASGAGGRTEQAPLGERMAQAPSGDCAAVARSASSAVSAMPPPSSLSSLLALSSSPPSGKTAGVGALPPCSSDTRRASASRRAISAHSAIRRSPAAIESSSNRARRRAWPAKLVSSCRPRKADMTLLGMRTDPVPGLLILVWPLDTDEGPRRSHLLALGRPLPSALVDRTPARWLSSGCASDEHSSAFSSTLRASSSALIAMLVRSTPVRCDSLRGMPPCGEPAVEPRERIDAGSMDEPSSRILLSSLCLLGSLLACNCGRSGVHHGIGSCTLVGDVAVVPLDSASSR